MNDKAFTLLVADLFEASGLLREVGEEIAATQGQSQARWQLLSVISNGPRTVPNAARRLGVSRQSVQRVANDLVHENLARFEPNPEHKASLLLTMTPAGIHTYGRITVASVRFHKAVLPLLNEADLESARRTLRAVMEAVRSISADRGVS